MNNMSNSHDSTQNDQQPMLGLQRIYIKDFSYEAPAAPHIFKETNWKPDILLDIDSNAQLIEKDVYEVVLSVRVTAKSAEATGFLLEIKQAGIFTLSNFDPQTLEVTLGAFCPSMLYPYAREAVTDMVNRGSFPQLLLAPINFDAWYAAKRQQEQGDSAAGGSAQQGSSAVN